MKEKIENLRSMEGCPINLDIFTAGNESLLYFGRHYDNPMITSNPYNFAIKRDGLDRIVQFDFTDDEVMGVSLVDKEVTVTEDSQSVYSKHDPFDRERFMMYDKALARWEKKGKLEEQVKSNDSGVIVQPSYAILMIDLSPEGFEDQNGIFRVAKKDQEKLIKSHSSLLTYCAESDTPVIVGRLDGEKRTLAELESDLNSVPRTYDISREKRYDGTMDDVFTNPGLLAQVDDLGVTHLIISGIYGSACVQKTWQTAVLHGITPLSSKDLIAERVGFQDTYEIALGTLGMLMDDVNDVISSLKKSYR